MSLASIYNFRKRPQLGPIEVTMARQEVYTLTADMPTSPVEIGSDIADHRRVKAEVFAIDGVISDVAMRSEARLGDDGTVTRQPGQFQGLTINEAYAQLYEVFVSAEPFDVVTNLKSLTNMHFTSLRIVRDHETSSVLSFSAELQQIQFASSQGATVRVVRASATDAPKVDPPTKPGVKKPKPVEPESLLHSIVPLRASPLGGLL